MMVYQDDSFILIGDKVIDYCKKNLLYFNDAVDLDEIDTGAYNALSCYAVYLRDSIINNSITIDNLKKIFSVLNVMAESNDPETINLLMVGIFEILTDDEKVIKISKVYLSQKAINIFDKTILWWNKV